MKIRVNEKVAVEVRVIESATCPAGTAYYVIEYCIDGICIHKAYEGPMYGRPNPIKTLDNTYDYDVVHYQDGDYQDEQPNGESTKNRKIFSGSYGGRSAWWEKLSKTHRECIIENFSQIVQ